MLYVVRRHPTSFFGVAWFLGGDDRLVGKYILARPLRIGHIMLEMLFFTVYDNMRLFIEVQILVRTLIKIFKTV